MVFMSTDQIHAMFMLHLLSNYFYKFSPIRNAITIMFERTYLTLGISFDNVDAESSRRVYIYFIIVSTNPVDENILLKQTSTQTRASIKYNV